MVRGRIVVIGGSGFVGSKVLQRSVESGFPTVAVNRSGRPKGLGSWANKVEWVKADALEPSTYESQLKGARLVVVACGLPPIPMDYKKAIRINGEANVTAIRAAADADVPHLLLINATCPGLLRHVAPGYVDGKRMAADAALEAYEGKSAIIAKPSVISGVRRVDTPLFPLFIPLNLLYIPLRVLAWFRPVLLMFLPPSLVVGVVEPPTSTDALARLATSHDMWEKGVAVLDPSAISARAAAWKAGSPQ